MDCPTSVALHRRCATICNSQKCNDDIVILQEYHCWGCGKHETQWRIPGWTFYVTADAQHRHTGVAVIISEKVARSDEISFAPGSRDDYCMFAVSDRG